MVNRSSLILSVCCLTMLVILGCRSDDSRPDGQEMTIPQSNDVTVVDPVHVLLKADLVVPQLTRESGINEIEKVRRGPDGEWVILNHLPRNNITELLIFAGNGAFQHRIRGSFDGPGNFTDLNDFLISGDTLELFDGVQNKRVLYTIDGQFIGENRFYPDVSQIIKLKDDLYAVYRGNAYQYAHQFQESDNLVMVDQQGKVQAKGGVNMLPAMRDNVLTANAFRSTLREEVFFLPPAKNIIYAYQASSSTWEPYLYIQQPNQEEREQALQQIADLPPASRKFDILQFLNAHDRWIPNFRNYTCSKNYLILNYAQAGKGVFAIYDLTQRKVQSFTFSPNLLGNYYLLFLQNDLVLFALTNPYYLWEQLQRYPDVARQLAPVFDQWEGEPNPLFISLPLDTFVDILLDQAS